MIATNAHNSRSLRLVGLSQTCICDTAPKLIRTGKIIFHNPSLKVESPKGDAHLAVNSPKRRILHRPASDPLCRFHGAGGGHGPGAANPAYKHGMRSQEWVDMRKAVNEMIRESREIERMIK